MLLRLWIVTARDEWLLLLAASRLQVLLRTKFVLSQFVFETGLCFDDLRYTELKI